MAGYLNLADIPLPTPTPAPTVHPDAEKYISVGMGDANITVRTLQEALIELGYLEDGEADEKLQFMTDYIFLSGSWGSLENHYAASGVRDEKRTGSKEGSRMRFRMQALFPSAEVLSRRYPVLRKAPWLLPVMWPVRWVSAALFRRENIRSYQQSLEGKTDEKLDSFENALSYVGLGFDF